MDDEDVLGTISRTLLEMVSVLGRIEERLGHIESLVSPVPVVTFDFARGEVTDQAEYEQSVLKRSWDAVSQRWVYEPSDTPGQE